MKLTKKHALLISVLAILMALCTIAGATLAYLFVKTNDVVNTFSPSNIGLTLTETTNTYKMIPGETISKDPKVTVEGDIASYVFVKIVETGSVTVDETAYTFDDFLTYATADGWTVLEGTVDTNDSTNGNETVVVYRAVGTGTNTFSVLVGDQVTTNASVTKQMMNAYTDGSIKLTFTAYAIQQAGFATPAAAWAEAQKAYPPLK